MDIEPKVIGEGAYGCVHKPSLKCKDESIILDYNNKISKIMVKESAESEMDEYIQINKIDPEKKYHISPIKCIPEKNKKMLEQVLNCKKIGERVEKYFDDYELIVMEYGGKDLYQLFKDPINDTVQNRKRIYEFWIQSVNIFKAVQLFIKNGLIHHDLKPENIVYDEDKKSMKVIDFGLLKTKDRIIYDTESSDYGFAMFYFNFPPEMIVYNKNMFSGNEELVESGKIDEKKISKFFDDYIDKNPDYTKSLNGFMQYVKSESLHPQLREKMVSDFIDYINHIIKPNEYDEYGDKIEKNEEKVEVEYYAFLKKSMDTIDVYGLGLTFMFVLVKVHKLMDEDIVLQLHNLFLSMFHSNLLKRINIDDALKKLESIIILVELRIATQTPSISSTSPQSTTSSYRESMSSTSPPSSSRVPLANFSKSTSPPSSSRVPLTNFSKSTSPPSSSRVPLANFSKSASKPRSKSKSKSKSLKSSKKKLNNNSRKK